MHWLCISLLLLVCVFLLVACHEGINLLGEALVCNGISPFDSIKEFTDVGCAVELATLIGILQGGKKCKDVLSVTTCVDRVILVCRKM